METLLSDLHRRTATAATTLKHDNASKIVEAVILAKARAGDALQRGMGYLQDASDNGSLPLDAVLDGRVAALVADAWVVMQVRVCFYVVPKNSSLIKRKRHTETIHNLTRYDTQRHLFLPSGVCGGALGRRCYGSERCYEEY